MATLVLGIAGAAAGASLFGAGFTVFGAAITGAQIGGALGTALGARIDGALLGGAGARREGPRLSDPDIQTSTEGAAIPRVFGRARVAGQIIWATKFKETIVKSKQSSGGGKGGAPKATVEQTEYRYAISFAVGLAEGRATKIGRVWADGKLLDLSKFTMRFYPGTEDQDADPLIEDIEGAGNTPSYRGLCHVVFEDMELAQFGNRIPQLQFELVRAITADNPTALENTLKGVALIPGAGEFVYATDIVASDDGKGATAAQNAHNSDGTADAAASLDELTAIAPNLESVALVAGWFGNDLRAGEIVIKPGVETEAKDTYPQTWRVNGVERAGAHVVSQIDGRPAYGGTPSDEAVVQAIQDLKARDLRVVFYPFLFLDVPPENTLPNPYSDDAAGTGQPAHPWRGRVTVSPAPGFAGSPDKTASAATQVTHFFGSATASDFAVDGATVTWSGGADWGWRRVVLHYAHLCQVAGGVDAFLIGSELKALTRVRSSATAYPAVAELIALAAEVRAVVGSGTKIGYGADWSEYNNHQTGDAAGAVLFNLDPLWADGNIDFVGIDNYMPLADWRDGADHLDYDAANGPTAPHDPAYLAANIRGGEYYDWYYVDQAARDAQTRTAITDAAHGKAWVWRAKDIWNWWANAHYDRPDGSESPTPTQWVGQGKPIWFAELGCPAADKGANQPNVFFDPKSSESALPHFSNAGRDDLIQRRFLEAHLDFWTQPANNPVSGVYAASMVDAANTHVWTWDARPFPFFPSRSDVWGDTENYRLGHWLNGRLGAVLLADLVRALCDYANFTDYDVANLSGLVTGYVVDGTMSAREAIEPLGVAYHFDAVESAGIVRFLMRGRAPSAAIATDDLVVPDGRDDFGFVLERAQETDLPRASRISYIDAGADYRRASIEARRLTGRSDRVAESALPIMLDQSQAVGIGERLLQDAWTMRERAGFALAPSRLALDPGDEVVLEAGGRARRFRLTAIADEAARVAQAVATDPTLYETVVGAERGVRAREVSALAGRAQLVFLDLPLITGEEVAHAPHVAAYAKPWPGAVLLYRGVADVNYAHDISLTRPAAIGELLFDFYSGPSGRWDKGNALWLALYDGALSSKSEADVLGGANALGVENEDDAWEIVQFRDAELVAAGQWKLTRLLRGLAGTEGAMRHPMAAGARVVILDEALVQLGLSRDESRLPFFYRWGPQGRDIGDPAYQGTTRAFDAIGLRPLSPDHLRARWPAVDGDIVISWRRRTRIGGDAWEQPDVPLGEDSEAYEIDIFDGETIVRTLSASSQQATYTLAQQTADFGGQQWAVDVAVHQLSAAYGRGAPARATLYY